MRHALKLSVTGLLALALVAAAFDFAFPLPLKERQFTAIVTAADGTPLRAFADREGVWRYPVTLDDVSPLYLQALLNYEDRWFYRHPGVNPFALARAGWQWATHGEIVSGGSTLTMQVARILDRHGRSVGGKLWQILRALQLEAHLSKDEILALYLNCAPFGGPLEGVQAASYAYLGRSAKELSHAEAALLAVLPQSPSRLRPDRHPDRAQKARDKVLARLGKFSVWDTKSVNDARREIVVSFYRPQPMLAPLLAQRLKDNADASTSGRGSVASAINANLQASLEARLQNRIERMPAGTSAAVIVVENASLYVRAYLGSADIASDARFGHLDMLRAARSPGSTLKPFLYGFALDEGMIHSESLLADAPQSFAGYRPANFSGGFLGPVSATEALQRSLNVPAVDLLDRLGPERFAARLRNAGVRLQYDGRPTVALILGGAAATLEQLAGAYAALGRDGLAGMPRLRLDDPLREQRVLSPGAAWIVRDVLESNLRPDLPTQAVNFGSRRVAWKTGTSYGFRDAWAMGVTDAYTVGVWIGRPDGTPVPGSFGAVTALPLLFEIVDSLPRNAGGRRAPRPASVQSAEICWPLGTPPQVGREQLCQLHRTAWVLNGVIPPTLPDRAERVWAGGVQRVWVNAKTGLTVDAGCAVPVRAVREFAHWPVALEPWLPRDVRAQALPPPVDPACRRAAPAVADTLHITGLPDRSIVRRAGRRTVKSAAPDPTVTLVPIGGRGDLYWLVNGNLVERRKPRERFVYRFPSRGLYEVTVFDESGAYDRVSLSVVN